MCKTKGSLRKLLKRLNTFLPTHYSDLGSAPRRWVTSRRFCAQRARGGEQTLEDRYCRPTLSLSVRGPCGHHLTDVTIPIPSVAPRLTPTLDPSPHAPVQLGNGSLVEGRALDDVITVRHRRASVIRSRRFPPFFPAPVRYGNPEGPGSQPRLGRD